MTKQLYLGLWASNPKDKTTLFPKTLEVDEDKVVLFFRLKTPKRSYGSFYVLLKIKKL